MGCTDLSIWGLIKVAYQVGGKIVNDSVNGVWIIIWGQNLHDSFIEPPCCILHRDTYISWHTRTYIQWGSYAISFLGDLFSMWRNKLLGGHIWASPLSLPTSSISPCRMVSALTTDGLCLGKENTAARSSEHRDLRSKRKQHFSPSASMDKILGIFLFFYNYEKVWAFAGVEKIV